jgi:hypothetical protein
MTVSAGDVIILGAGGITRADVFALFALDREGLLRARLRADMSRLDSCDEKII